MGSQPSLTLCLGDIWPRTVLSVLRDDVLEVALRDEMAGPFWFPDQARRDRPLPGFQEAMRCRQGLSVEPVHIEKALFPFIRAPLSKSDFDAPDRRDNDVSNRLPNFYCPLPREFVDARSKLE